MSYIKKFDWSNVAKPPYIIAIRYLEEAQTYMKSGA